MEFVTLLLVVSLSLYFITVGPVLVRSLLQFFIINLLISSIFLFGIVLLIFLMPEMGKYILSYYNFVYYFQESYLLFGDPGGQYDLHNVLVYFKIIFAFILIPLLFKLTLAPLSI